MKKMPLSATFTSIAAAALLVAASLANAHHHPNPASYTGQGLIADGFGGFDLRTELCGIENGADAQGPYLLWVLTATGANNADITGPWGTVAMTKTGNGTFKYISGWYDPSTLPGNVSATYDGRARNAQLVVSHGCRPFNNEGAWCSPGFWRNARAGAWSLVGKSSADAFDGFVSDYWFGNNLGVTLGAVLGNPQTYSGSPVPGTSGYQLNAFNATGAALTDLIPGYSFDWAVMTAGGSDACPIDSFGNLK
jgi:hypothetical protein